MQDEQVHFLINNPFLLYIYCQTMRALKATPKSLNNTLRKPLTTDKIVKKSDMKLNDVLINGVRLNCFKVVKNRRIILSRKNIAEEDISGYSNIELEQEGEVALFKNNAIRRRLKSLEIEPLGNKNHQETVHNKKTFTPYHKLSIEIPPPSSSQPKTRQQKLPAQELIESFKLADLNSKYYGQLKKELMMYSTKNRFNSSTIKRKIEFGKYIGLKSHKQKRHASELESNLIQVKIGRFDKESQNRMRTNPEQGSSTEQDQRLRNSILSEKMDTTVNSSQKLKICYSNMFQLKQWKEYPDENINSMRETSRSVTSHNQ